MRYVNLTYSSPCTSTYDVYIRLVICTCPSFHRNKICNYINGMFMILKCYKFSSKASIIEIE